MSLSRCNSGSLLCRFYIVRDTVAWQDANIALTVYTARGRFFNIHPHDSEEFLLQIQQYVLKALSSRTHMGSDRLRSWLSCRFFRSQGSPDAIVMGIILLCAHQSRKVFVFRYLPPPTVQYHSHRSNSRMFISHFDHSPDSPGSIPSTHFTLLNHNSRHADPGPQTSPQLHIKPHKLNHTIYMTQRPGSQYTVSTVYSISMCVCSY